MKAVNYIFSTLIAVGLTLGSKAQEGEFRMTASWQAGLPMGGLTELTNNASLRGADVTILYGINPRMSVGLQGSYTDFYEKFPRAIYQLQDGSDVSAVLSNSVQQIPIMAAFRYQFLPESRVKPYASVAAGGNIIMYKQYLGEYPSSDSKVGFAARPEIGVYWPFKKYGETGINLGLQYTYAPYNRLGVNNVNYMGVKLGIGFPMRN